MTTWIFGRRRREVRDHCTACGLPIKDHPCRLLEARDASNPLPIRLEHPFDVEKLTLDLGDLGLYRIDAWSTLEMPHRFVVELVPVDAAWERRA